MNPEIDSPYLFVGGKGRVYALLKRTGAIVWDIELKKGGLFGMKGGCDFVTLVEGQSNLFAFAYGTAYCLSKSTGKVMWQSEIKDLKNHIASLAVDANLVGARRSGNADGAWVAAGAGGDGGDGDGDGGGGDGGD
jgi:outer membrane protein assembly factor BamB